MLGKSNNINFHNSFLLNIYIYIQLSLYLFGLFYSSFQAEKMVCGALQKGNVMAIFGPQDDYIAEHIKSITDMIEIPFIDTR